MAIVLAAGETKRLVDRDQQEAAVQVEELQAPVSQRVTSQFLQAQKLCVTLQTSTLGANVETVVAELLIPNPIANVLTQGQQQALRRSQTPPILSNKSALRMPQSVNSAVWIVDRRARSPEEVILEEVTKSGLTISRRKRIHVADLLHRPHITLSHP